jgi:hypothetical protein
VIDFSKLPLFAKSLYQVVEGVGRWAEVYGTSQEAIERQILLAHEWLVSNKTTRKNVTRFLFNWMRIAKEMGNLTVSAKRESFKEAKPDEKEVMTGEDFRRLKAALPPRRSDPSLARLRAASIPTTEEK